MTKAILRFDLPEDQGDFHAATHGREAISALWEIDNRCRALLKYGEPTEEQIRLAEEIRAMIPWRVLEEE